ncbi:MAG: hypothetical protein HYV24_12005 [Deltaproteobacteria bacterium]|nr:hypothetical protein [Deltaproteobacteria bacterium]
MTGDRKWYLVYTKPRNEDALEKKFLDAGLEVLNPKVKERKYVRRRVTEAVSPLFPCYVFVKFDVFRNYRFVKYARGVKKLVGFENCPTPVSDGIISSIEERTEGGFVAIRKDMFRAGDAVHIKAGPLSGFDAIFEREVKDTERVSILLKAVNARVVVDQALLSKIS